MNKKIILAALLGVASTGVMAASQTLQATIEGWNEATITEDTPLHFGKIRPTAGSACTMDNAGAVTGNCDASDANLALGAITVTGLAASTAMNITVTGSSSANLTFAAASTATDGTSNVNTTDGNTSAFTTDATGSDITMSVYGVMTVDTALTAGQSYDVDYTVDVSFQ